VIAAIRGAEHVERGKPDHLAISEGHEAELRPPARPLDLELTSRYERRRVLGVEAQDVLTCLEPDAVHAILQIGPLGPAHDHDAVRR
jgi:hypothetical protein